MIFAAVDCARRGEAGMEPDHGVQGNAGVGELERHHAAETEPDRGDTIWVDARLRHEHVVSGQPQSAGRVRVLEQLAETSLSPASGCTQPPPR